MVKDFFKNKKTIGIIVILGIILIISVITYYKFGFKELKKNDTENIFVDNVKNENMLKNKSTEDNDESKDTPVELKEKYIVVEIKGEVSKPDVYKLKEDSIVKDLIDVAGGLKENADLSNINRAKKLQNHELIYIGNINNTASNNTISNNTLLNKGTSSGKVNINTATIEELKTLNGIGDTKAKKIIEYREKNGGFKSIDDMKNVDGIGDKMFEKIKDQMET